MKNIFFALITVFTLISFVACKPGVYYSPVPGQNTTVMAAAPVPTATTAPCK